MSVSYFKRFRMEIELRSAPVVMDKLPAGYRLVPWSDQVLGQHAEVKYHSFRNEIDAGVFSCLGELAGCQRLMAEIAAKEGFAPEATWLMKYLGVPRKPEMCGTIQGVRVSRHLGAIQNVGVTPFHRGHGVGAALVQAALLGFQQLGVQRAYLEVTAENVGAIRLYERLGFRRTKTLYKAVQLAYS